MKAKDDMGGDYKRLLNTLPGLVYRSAIHADGSRTLVYVSEGSRQLVGCEPGELVGRERNPLMAFIHSDDAQHVIQVINKAVESRTSYKMAYRIRQADETIQWVLDQGCPIYDDDGFPYGVEGIIINYTDEKIREMQALRELESLRRSLDKENRFGQLVGSSKAMLTVYHHIRRAAESDFPVIVLGPTGSGKELVANEIALNSPYCQPVITVNCAAIPRELLEGAFFGHIKGSFTGAIRDNPGYLRMANGGTLFLDEIADLSLDMQVKLLRALETKQFFPVGSAEPKTSNFRLISATNKNLEQEVREKRMREDFYYRIKVLTIEIPPLRDRREDIPLLIDHICLQTAHTTASQLLPLELRQAMEYYDWPGNIRELRNCIERYLVLGEAELSALVTPQTEIAEGGNTIYKERRFQAHKSLKTIVREVEQEVIAKTIAYHGGNKSKAAHSLEISLQSLYRKLSP